MKKNLLAEPERSHQSPLDIILEHACPAYVNGDERTFSIEVHCVEFLVTTRPKGDGTYEVLSLAFLDE